MFVFFTRMHGAVKVFHAKEQVPDKFKLLLSC